ncbi:gliding motility lipoprotein GldH [uncultured Flavobacterium sp.]|uniref:gliding motility lipoprotein GldH n=1 Tax=uncultured Flavobacterium sp. TaxID=165435 RepID=UPI0026013922|nr:gliding motility lipoprotein GldH [uncultured Flavobacterium sp.]
MSLKNSFLILFLAILLVSCDKKRVFDQYKTVGDAWQKDSIASFTYNNQDTTQRYDLFLNLRSNNDYPFNNIFLIVSMEAPGGMTKVDTLQYQMAEADGKLMGEGFSDVKESKLFYKEKYKFSAIGDYKIGIQQAVRQSGKVAGEKELKGITEVGFRIEKLD